ncbi:hypothetical protein ACNOHN_00465 [Bacteroides zhangwenhongii]|uniref:hypothetical protein n=1 Tax=Bacteroides TaxID=816 RepID=UPI0015FA05FE|nr:MULTISPECIES: hypothetical protein [Bacteroides]MDF0565885.1 hypothetical protein [Bacteroides xylanisolvens]
MDNCGWRFRKRKRLRIGKEYCLHVTGTTLARFAADEGKHQVPEGVFWCESCFAHRKHFPKPPWCAGITFLFIRNG